MGFSITVTRVFSAAHAVRFQDGVFEPLHGHNWEVRVTLRSKQLDEVGFVADFHELDAALDAVLKPLHNANLNAVTDLSDLNPTAENVAFHIARRLSPKFGAMLARVEVTEAPGCLAAYEP